MAHEQAPPMHNPLLSLPQRRPGAHRRTTSLESLPRRTWKEGIVWRGTARDARVKNDGTLHETSSAHLAASIDESGNLLEIKTGLESADGLVGASVTRGFRARLADLPIGSRDELVEALLDDLPTVRVVSGYARAHQDLSAVAERDSSFMIGVCTGWAVEHMPRRRSEAGSLAQIGPAPALSSMLATADDFHPEPPLVPVSMRRRRILEVVEEGDILDVFEYFRDSHIGADGIESALHEYIVRARLDRAHGTVLELSAEPRALPFGECPLATTHLPSVVGHPIQQIDSLVRSELRGGRGCTHLNDTVRFLRYAPGLASGPSDG
jgi:hypothetical protein